MKLQQNIGQAVEPSDKYALTFLGKLGVFIRDCICVCTVVFAVLMGVASIALMIPTCTGKFAYGYVMSVSCFGVCAYCFVIFAVWMLLEYCNRKWPNLLKGWGHVFIIVLNFLVCLIKLLPALVHVEGEMAWDSLMVLKSITAGKVCFFHSANNHYWCNYEILVFHDLAARTDFIARMKGRGAQCVFHYLALHASAYYASKHDGRALANCDRFAECLVRLPLFYELDSDFVVKCIMEVCA